MGINGTKQMLNCSLSVNLNATFLLKSAYLRHTHSHMFIMGNLNATSPKLHYCLKIQMHQGTAVSVISLTVQHPAYLQFFVSSLGQFSSQSVQALFDRAIH